MPILCEFVGGPKDGERWRVTPACLKQMEGFPTEMVPPRPHSETGSYILSDKETAEGRFLYEWTPKA